MPHEGVGVETCLEHVFKQPCADGRRCKDPPMQMAVGAPLLPAPFQLLLLGLLEGIVGKSVDLTKG